ncbi:MAG: methyltransferase domain-containing protein [Deltaproteobacteria bacterium]|nr:methyltransferase domain-containing protein [Deltaproteobacteria bacterium]
MPNGIDVWKFVESFRQARIILTAVELGIFEAIGRGAKTAKFVAEQKECSERGITFLLDALSSFGILKKRAKTYSIEKDLQTALSPFAEDSILPILKHAANMWQKWHHLTQVVKTGRPAVEPNIRNRAKSDTLAFIGAMHAIGTGLAGSIVRDCKVIDKAKRILDIGGASGTYTIAFLKKYKNLSATIFDLPDVIPLAKGRIEKAGLNDRVNFCEGDFEFDDLPYGYDAALLFAIIHQNSREENRILFKKVFDALTPHGILLLRDHVMNKDRTSPRLGAVFAINMLVATNGGGTYTFDEIKDDLASAGFSGIKMIRKGDYMDCVIKAGKK